jgi:asparagine synthase (glutamine-hydrolysing)
MGMALFHRGPDDSGIFHDEETGVGFSFRRLAILDLSEQGHQPMFSVSGRYVIVFNGEVYNFEDIRKELGLRAWQGHSDTEVILEAIETWGLEAAAQRFVGMFAFALWDCKERRLHLVRDRIGIKPLYFGKVGGEFVFASELKAIAQYPGFAAEIDRDVLTLYMRYNCVPTPHCIYKGFQKLQAGSILTLASATGSFSIKPFWSALEVAAEGVRSPWDISDADGIDAVEKALMEAVKLRMIADVPLGAFLSGGVDSTTVVALMQAQSNRSVKTFTIGFREHDYDEATHAKCIAKHLGTEHTELYVTAQEALDVVPLLASMYDEPFADASQIPTFLISKLARQSVTVSLSGDGGDELFGGYTRYSLTKSMSKYLKTVPKPLRKVAARMIYSMSPAGIDRFYGLAKPLISGKKRVAAVGDKAHKFAGFLELDGPEAIYLRALSHWESPTEVVLGSFEPTSVSEFIQQCRWLHGIEEVMMLTDLVHYLPDDILTKVDRASMAVSLEARVPILDHRIVELAWRLPLHFKIRNGVSKWILRQVLYKYVPAALVDRPKMGFAVPIDSWLRGPLRPWAEDLLAHDALKRQGIFNVERIRRRWEEHLSGARNWQYLIWDVLMFQDWSHHNLRALPPA